MSNKAIELTTKPFSNNKNYREKLTNRGNLFFWISPETVEQWIAPHYGAKHRPLLYSDEAIQSILEFRAFLDCSLDTIVGIISSFFEAAGIDHPVPHPSTLCRRARQLNILYASQHNFESPLNLLLDSTGFHIYDAATERPGKPSSRQSNYTDWYKVHIALNLQTQEIISVVAGSPSVHDCSAVEDLLPSNQVIDTVRMDGIYDQWKVWKSVVSRGAIPILPPKRNARIRRKHPPPGAEYRNAYITRIHELQKPGLSLDEARKEWKKEAKYHARSLVETAMYRLKRVLGRSMRARNPETRFAEICLRISALNRITEMLQN